ncbi:MAG: ABC transporter permease [Candidatus Kapaibacterium sp.]
MTRIVESIRPAFIALAANKMRAVLTTLGVVIGIFFVLLMGWVLNGLDTAFTQSFAFFGDDILYIDKFDWSGGEDWYAQRNRPKIDSRQYELFKERMRGAEFVVPTIDRFSTNVRHENLQLQGSMVFGTTAEYIDMYSGITAEGRFFTETEAELGANVVVLGQKVNENLFPQGDALGKVVKIDGQPFTVIGVLPKRGTMLIDFIDNMSLIPIKRFFSLYGSRSSLTINVKAGGKERLDDVKYEAIGVMRSVRSLKPDDDDNFGINSQEMFSQFIDITRGVVWGIGLFMTGLAFLVGSIGIMNIMFVSVAERTREIGVRKAVGATQGRILLQFLFESIILSLIGAAIGLILTSTIAAFKDQLVSGVISLLSLLGIVEGDTTVNLSFLSSTIPLTQVVVAVVVAVVVGILAGIIPAFRAARLNPVEALRAE